MSWGWTVHFLAAASPNSYTAELERSGVVTHRCGPNQSAEFEKSFEEADPDVVVFDRFMAEEAFSFQVRGLKPDATRVLDMQDMHSLRRARQGVVQAGGGVAEALVTFPDATNSADLARELASIHRSDLTFVCSPFELDLLVAHYGIPSEKLTLASFFCDPVFEEEGSAQSNFCERSGFVTIGNFMHAPNLDSVNWLCTDVWPQVRREIPDATLQIFGAYPGRASSRMGCGDGGVQKGFHDPSRGVYFRGQVGDVASAMASPRVLLAPLRFGAGIKGKIVDAWRHGIPVVTTPIGAEGMVPFASLPSLPTSCEAGNDRDNRFPEWGGSWQSLSATDIASNAVRLHEDIGAWGEARREGITLLNDLYSRDTRLSSIRVAMERCIEELPKVRQRDFVGAMLWHHSLRSTEYFSRWIELKESIATRR